MGVQGLEGGVTPVGRRNRSDIEHTPNCAQPRCSPRLLSVPPCAGNRLGEKEPAATEGGAGLARPPSPRHNRVKEPWKQA